MKIGIIVHSSTGNTLHVAQRLQQRLSAAGHSALVERVSAMNDEESDVQKIRISQKNRYQHVRRVDFRRAGARLLALACHAGIFIRHWLSFE